MSASLLEILRAIPDRRRAEGRRYELSAVVFCSILGMVAGANSYRQMHEFIRVHFQLLNEAFGLGLRGPPSYTGLRDILLNIDAERKPRFTKSHFQRDRRARVVINLGTHAVLSSPRENPSVAPQRRPCSLAMGSARKHLSQVGPFDLGKYYVWIRRLPHGS
jgi:hypothetical protein